MHFLDLRGDVSLERSTKSGAELPSETSLIWSSFSGAGVISSSNSGTMRPGVGSSCEVWSRREGKREKSQTTLGKEKRKRRKGLTAGWGLEWGASS